MLKRHLTRTNLQFSTSIGHLDPFEVGNIAAIISIGPDDSHRRAGGSQRAFGSRTGRIGADEGAAGCPPFTRRPRREVKERSTVGLSVGVAIPG